MTRTLLVMLAVTATASAGCQTGPAVKCLIITGDHGHDWKATTPVIKEESTQIYADE